MLTLAAIKENPQEIVRRLAVKHFDAEKLINEILELDQARRTAQARFDQNGADLNKLAAQANNTAKVRFKIFCCFGDFSKRNTLAANPV